MIYVPLLEGVSIRGYGLFPGEEPGEGLSIRFLPGTTLVLGANGLGKTTLINILYRLLAGPYDIPALMSPGPLGGSRTSATRLSVARRRVFAERVRDGASEATASLTFSLGDTSVRIERHLRNLHLIELAIDGQVIHADELGYQSSIVELTGLSSYGDWILLLRQLVFYFEDRRALVWDPSAQRQILRFLLLDSTLSREWTSKEREVLELDSRARNMSATLYQWEQQLQRAEADVEAAPDIHDQLRALEGSQATDLAAREEFDAVLVEMDEARTELRLRQLTAEQTRESAYRDLERLRLVAIGNSFPDQSTTARYILAQLFASHECLVCGSAAGSSVGTYSRRLEEGKCVVCATELQASSDESVSSRDIVTATERLLAADEELASAQRDLAEAETSYDRAFEEVHALSAAILRRSREIDSLVGRLPPEEADLHQTRDDLANLRRRLALLREDLAVRRQRFADFIAGVNLSVVEWSDEIVQSFTTYARGFLIEEAQLVWSPHRARVGETGEQIEFPSFELDLGGTDFVSPVRRSGPDEVSESQREFIDLAFRMALMTATTTGRSGSLVIDAPESSLDAVFVSRAAEVLASFGAPQSENRLVLASNLVEGELIPEILERSVPRDERTDRIVDLLSVATPTAAVREHRDEYARVRDRLLSRALE